MSFLKDRNFTFPFLIWFVFLSWYFLVVHNYFDVLRIHTDDFIAEQAFSLQSYKTSFHNKIVIVAIDESTRRFVDFKWPWPRRLWAELVTELASYSPRVIGIDVIFSGKSTEEDDNALREALSSHPNILLASVVLPGEKKELPQEMFQNAVKMVGYVNKPTYKKFVSRSQGMKEVDKVIRDTSLLYIEQGKFRHYSMDVALLAAYFDVPLGQIELSPRQGIIFGNKFSFPITFHYPAQEEMLATIFSNPSAHIIEGIAPLWYSFRPEDFDIVSAADVLTQRVNPHFFEDKIVLIGAIDPLIHDEFRTPLGVFPGVTIIANSLQMMLQRLTLRSVSRLNNFYLIFFLGFFLLFLNRKLTFSRSTLLILLVASASFFGFLYARGRGIRIDYFAFFMFSSLAYFLPVIYRYSHLLYVGNRLKNMAIVDTLTGFFSFRYFILTIDGQLRDKAKESTCYAFIIDNYRKLSFDLAYEDLQSLVRILSVKFRSSLQKKELHRLIRHSKFCRISQDSFGVTVQFRSRKQPDLEIFRDLLNIVRNSEVRIEGKPVRFSVKGVYLRKPRGVSVSGLDFVETLEDALKQLREDFQEDFVKMEFQDKKTDLRKKTKMEDIFDFLTTDLEERNKELERTYKELLISKKETEDAYFEAMRSLIKALEEKDIYTQGHSERVAAYALSLAMEMHLSPRETEIIYKAALLHDIGKIGIPEYILHKKEKLTDEEFNMIKRHEIKSVEILKPIKPFKPLLPLIILHHEKYDGTGYPYGLSGDMIPAGAKILSICDAFDAITCGRGYKKGTSVPEAIIELERSGGTQFDPVMVQALKRVLKSTSIQQLWERM